MSAPDRTRTGTPYPDPAAPQAVGAALFGGPVGSSVAEHREATATSGPEVVERGVDYSAIRSSADFEELRARLLRFTVPMVALFMANFMLFVVLSAYAPDFMATPAIGLINIGLLIGVFQFVTTVTIVVGYGRYARTRIDPLADRIRDEVEGR